MVLSVMLKFSGFIMSLFFTSLTSTVFIVLLFLTRTYKLFINPLPQFYMVGDFSRSFSQTENKFNFNINVNVTVDSYMNRSSNFSFSQLLKNLLASRILKLGSTSRITA